jgi:uncharacterized cupin superfamily protein
VVGSPHLLTATDVAALAEVPRQHQFNDNAIRHTRSIGDALGLTTIGVHLVRVEPGRESTQFHFHHQDEEFIYILSGQGIAEIGDNEYEVGTGDFMAFSTNSLPHTLRNPFDTDLTYLMGGNRSDIDVCDYPRINRRMYRIDGVKTYVDLDNLKGV